MICAVGVGIYTVLLAVALGHMCKPFRCFTKIFGALIWVGIFGFFIASNVFRFREAGRLCSFEDEATVTDN